MSRASFNIRDVTAAQRGQIIQHVLVDGWSPAKTARVYGIGERQVARWVAAYRRRGMASLRGEAGARLPQRWLGRLRALTSRLSAALYGDFEARPARCIVLHRGANERTPQPGPDRRSRWN